VIEEGRVYIHFGTYGTACLDTATAKTIWERRDINVNHFRGPGSSPILHNGVLYVSFDGFDQQYFVALDAKTGKTLWRTDRNDPFTDNGDLKKAYGTASVIKVNGKKQVISSAANATYAYDPASGKQLWKVRHGGMNASARPLLHDGRLILTNGMGMMLRVKPDGAGDVTDTHIDWKLTKGVPTMSSLLLIDGLLYMTSNAGIASCVDPATGTVIWNERLAGNIAASPLYADGKIYVFDQEGTSHVLEPGRTAKVLAVNKLADGCMASPIAVDQSLIVRTKTHLYCIEKK
jgi:outer membrane protein assembly factor BamB